MLNQKYGINLKVVAGRTSAKRLEFRVRNPSIGKWIIRAKPASESLGCKEFVNS